MGLKIQRRVTTKARVIATLIAVLAFLVQPMVAMNIPAVFAASGPTILVSTPAELSDALAHQADGQIWQLATGTYDQTTLHITKKITIMGPADGSAVVKVPSTMTNGGKFVDIDSKDVVLKHLTLTGTFSATGCNNNEFGVYFENGASATIENSSILNMQDANTGLRGCQQGIAVRVGSHAAGIVATATIKNVTINGYQKGGIVVDGNGSSAIIKNSTITGAGPINYTAQNGIQVSRGATATIKNNTITGNSYTGADYAAGLLLYGAGDHTVVSGDTVTGNQVGYYTETQANLKYLDMSGISGNTRNAVAFTDASYNPAWAQPSSTWADAGISGQVNADGNDIVSTGGGLHVYGYDAFTTVPSAVQAVLANGTVNFGSDQTTTAQVTLAKELTLNGDGHTLSPNFAKTDNSNNSALGIQASGVVVKDLIEDGTHGTNLHGINVTGALTGISLNGVTVKNNSHSGLNVNASKVTVNDLTTAHNGWNGVDVDKTGAVLTVNGVSHHDETAGDIYVDNTSVGKVVDTNGQYDFANNVKQAGDRVYDLKLAAPTNLAPSLTNKNDFWFTWNAVQGAKSYEWQGSQSSAPDGNGNLANVTWTGDYQKNQPTAPKAHSVGASGTWYWQVRAVDSNGVKGPWSVIASVTIDMKAPAIPSDLSWTGSNSTPVLNNGFTNVQKGTLSWKTTTPADVDHYVYKFWTNIAGYQDDASHPWSDSYSYVVKTTDGGHVPTDFTNKPGTYFFCVEAVDKAGNNSGCSSTFAVTYDASAPVATITSPSAGLVHGVVTVSGTVADTNPDHYYFVVKNSSGTVVAGPATVDQAQVASWSWDTTKSKDGVYTIDLEARDKANNKDANSVATLQVTVDNTAPTVKITSSTQNTDGSWTFKGTTDDTAPVDVTISGVTKPYSTVLSNGVWSVTTGTDLTVGLHTATASSTDSTGNSSKVSSDNQVPFTIVVHSPALLLTVPSQLTTAPTATPGTLAGSFNTVGSATAPAADPAAVLGAQTAKDNSAILGTNDKVAAIAPSTQGWKIFGVAWYWWALIIAAVAAIMWWIIAAARRRNQNA